MLVRQHRLELRFELVIPQEQRFHPGCVRRRGNTDLRQLRVRLDRVIDQSLLRVLGRLGAGGLGVGIRLTHGFGRLESVVVGVGPGLLQLAEECAENCVGGHCSDGGGPEERLYAQLTVAGRVQVALGVDLLHQPVTTEKPFHISAKQHHKGVGAKRVLEFDLMAEGR